MANGSPPSVAWHGSLQALVPGRVRWQEPMALHTTLKVGGPAEAYVSPESEDEVVAVLRFCREQSVPLTVLGGGSNILVADAGIAGVVLDTQALRADIERTPEGDGELWTIGAGVTTIALVRRAVEAGLKGAEVLAGVPGTIGGAVIMNAGGHDGEIKDHAVAVRLANADGVSWWSAEACGFSYRASQIPKATVVVALRMRLQRGDQPALAAYVKQHMQKRQKSQPLALPNAGSFFKNPSGDFAGRLIEASQLKGEKIGCAEVSTLHANFLVREREKTNANASQDFVKLIDLVRQRVWLQHHVWLELEVRPIGEFSSEERRLLEARVGGSLPHAKTKEGATPKP